MYNAAQQAIQHALNGEFEKAIALNRQILKENPIDTEALNRLAFALGEIGEIKQAKQTYKKVLLVNRFNPIALKNIARLEMIKEGKKVHTKNDKNNSLSRKKHISNLFLEEVGKTKVVTLINLAEAKILSTLYPTNQVFLYSKVILPKMINQIPDSEQQYFINYYLRGLLKKPELMKTLAAYFACDLDLKATAQKLNIHKNTLYYRFDKIEKLIGLDPRSFQNAIKIVLALLMYQIKADDSSNNPNSEVGMNGLFG